MTGIKRVVIGEPDPLARRAIGAQFENDSEFSVIATTSDSNQVFELTRLHRPELVVIDASPEFDGIELCRRLIDFDAEAKILVLDGDLAAEGQLRAFRAGASGIVPRLGGADAILEASRQVLDGRIPHSDEAMGLLLKRAQSMPESGVGMRPVRSSLTPREWEVLDLLTDGVGTDDMAEKLFLSKSTVLSHIKGIFRKLEVSSRAEAVERGRQLRRPEPEADPTT